MQPMLRRVRRGSPLLLAVAMTVALAVPAHAHDAADGVLANHAYAGDPLFPMTSGTGLFVGHNPDGLTAMASTTKVMSLIIALEAVKNGVVSLQDDVTISPAAASQGGSSMKADPQPNGAPLASLEVMSFEDLLFGMMIPSGNNATWAVAEHVADGYLGSLGTVANFVSLMNTKASALGLTGTFYQNPTGYDAQLHWTTARHLARLWNSGMADPEFRRIVRPQTWVAHGTLFGTTKTYTLERKASYPGLEGYKNGISFQCSLFQEECFVASARRIGRRVIVSGMQADGWVGGKTGDAAEVFDHAFRNVFHPDERGSSALGSDASRLALVCPATGRTVAASIPSVGRTQVTSWNTNVDTQAHSIAGSATAPTGSLATTSILQGREVDAIALSATRVVTATNVGTAVELRLWNIPATGAPTTLGAAVDTRTAGSSKSIELVKLSSTMFASVARSSTDQLVLKTWRVTTSVLLVTSLTLLKTWVLPASDVLEVDAASAPGQQSLRFVTVHRRFGAFPLIQAWNVDATTGAMTGGASVFIPETGTLFSVVPAPAEALSGEFIVDKFYAIGFKRSNGGMGLVYARVGFNGTLGALSAVATAGTVTALELAPFGTSGIVSLTRLSNGTLKPIVWETRRNANGTVTGLRISDHGTTISGLEPEICATPTTRAEGDFISGFREGSPASVRLRGWRIGDRP